MFPFFLNVLKKVRVAIKHATRLNVKSKGTNTFNSADDLK
jgi:hypothetical protein